LHDKLEEEERTRLSKIPPSSPMKFGYFSLPLVNKPFPPLFADDVI